MKLKGIYYFSQRTKHLMVVAITILPIFSLMLVVSMTSFLPLFESMDKIVTVGYGQMRPLKSLQIALLKAVMPPNDHLIHGAEQEQNEWKRLKTEVDNAFRAAIESNAPDSRKIILKDLRKQWIDMAKKGDMLFLEAPGVLSRTAADEMERFDSSIERIVQQIRLQIDVMETTISGEYMLIEQRKWHGIIISLGAILLGMLLGVGGSVWLTRSRKKIINRSLIDSLTGIYNRRGLEQAFGRLNKCCLTNPPIGYSMLMMDIDKFKSINDRFGHDVGDLALKALAENTRTMIRSKDVFGRFGGEEFLLVLPETTSTEAYVLAERIREGIAAASIDLPGRREPLTITVSIGCATASTGSSGVEAVLKAADEAMYQAKASGRNQVVCKASV